MAEEWIERIVADIKARYGAQARQDLLDEQQALVEEAERLIAEDLRRRTEPPAGA